MQVKFTCIKGSDRLADNPFYIALAQHERTLSKREFYDLVAEYTGYKATAVRAVFMATAEFVRENQRKGNITYIDGVASIRNYVRGAFESLSGPWNKGVNLLAVNAVEMDPFKSAIAEVIAINDTEGAKPVINTVLDETTMVYDVVTGTDVFSIAGAELALDMEKDDEYVALVSKDGTETAARRAVHAQGLHQERARRPVRRPRGDAQDRGRVTQRKKGEISYGKT